MNKTILVYQASSTFVAKDLECLRHYSEVVEVEVGAWKGMKALLKNISAAIHIMLNIKRVNLIYIWFVDFHAFFPVVIGKLMRIKTAAVVGGSDAVSIPSLKIGLFSSGRFRQRIGRFCYRNADYLLAVDQSLIEGINRYADPYGNGLPTGFLSFETKPKGKIEVVPTSYDEDFWRYNSEVARKKDVVSVGYIHDEARWKLKGGDLLNDVAHEMPETDFYFYGLSDSFKNYLVSTGSIASNFYLMAVTDNDRLPQVFSSFKVYAQLSLTEGLPNVLCEAMLCGCIPVGSDVNGIPAAIGEAGVVVKHKDVKLAAKAIRTALKMGDEVREKARARIIQKFPKGKRQASLKELFFK